MKSFPANLLLVLCILCCTPRAICQTVSIPTASASLNRLVLEQIGAMPSGGGFAANHAASVRLQGSVRLESGRLLVTPAAAPPTYCSGATYLVFLEVIQALQSQENLRLDPDTLDQLLIQGQPDGKGIWGRWNANGPGTARLFHELGLGPNFTSLSEARPGDFMKVFWTTEVGSREHGHSVIFLGEESNAGVDSIRFWSSNEYGGYGPKVVPLARVSHMIFSRLENPANLARIRQIPSTDSYLASLQTKRSSFEEAGLKCGF